MRMEIDSFKCMLHPVIKHDLRRAEAEMKFNLDEFGLDYGNAHGFDMETKLEIQVEGIKQEADITMQ